MTYQFMTEIGSLTVHSDRLMASPENWHNSVIVCCGIRRFSVHVL